MIKKIAFILLIHISSYSYTQTDYTLIDNASKKVDYSLYSSKQIAFALTKDLHSDTEKARAIYIWITHNISYDYQMLENLPKYTGSKDFVNYVLKKRSGVCQHYADLFLDMTKSVGLDSFIISGYTRNYKGEISDSGHAWNAIKIDSEYYFIDTTWSAGYIKEDRYVRHFSDKYFLIKPENFIKTHIPFDPIWQFLPNPIRQIEFNEKNFERLNRNDNYPFEKIIKENKSLDEIKQVEQENRRMIQCGITNKTTRKELAWNLNHIAHLKFSKVIDTLNYAIENYNDYIFSKNNRFETPKLDESEIKELVDNACKAFNACKDPLLEISSTDVELNKHLNFEKDRLPDLIKSAEQEKLFVEKYLKKWKPLRKTMFKSQGYTKIPNAEINPLF